MSVVGHSRHFDPALLASALPLASDILSAFRDVLKVPDSTAANNNHEATNGGPPAQPTAAFRIITSARHPRSRPRGSWRICRQALPQAASV
jgi:hypothetical protein